MWSELGEGYCRCWPGKCCLPLLDTQPEGSRSIPAVVWYWSWVIWTYNPQTVTWWSQSSSQCPTWACQKSWRNPIRNSSRILGLNLPSWPTNSFWVTTPNSIIKYHLQVSIPTCSELPPALSSRGLTPQKSTSRSSKKQLRGSLNNSRLTRCKLCPLKNSRKWQLSKSESIKKQKSLRIWGRKKEIATTRNLKLVETSASNPPFLNRNHCLPVASTNE